MSKDTQDISSIPVTTSPVVTDTDEMYVTKRNQKLEIISFDKILKRIKNVGKKLNISVNFSMLAMKVIDQLHDKIETTKIDELTAEQCIMLSTSHPDYGSLASYISISNYNKIAVKQFKSVINRLYQFKDHQGRHHPLVNEDIWNIVNNNEDAINDMFDYERDFLIDYFGFKTLERAYLFKINGKSVERIQHLWMRVAIGIHGNNLPRVKETYDLMSLKYFTHATPTLFNAGTPRQQLSSCYLIGLEEDSIDGIYNTLKDTALISKYAGGIGLHIHNIRASGSHIRGTNGYSNGIVPMLKVYNNTARYVDQGGGRRNGSFAIYLEPWHKDIINFMELRKNHGDEEMKARDLFYGLWIPDLFMRRVKDKADWLLCCPDECRNLSDLYGEAFEKEYTKYEKMYSEGKLHNAVMINARDLWFKILDSQMETGTPYLLYKDAANRKSNQQNLGTIKSSNLCTEIIEYSDSKETAVCNLASIALGRFVKEDKTFDYAKLLDVVRVVTFNLNRVIDVNFYPTSKTQLSNLLHRPIGIGVQGLADAFFLMDIPFSSQDAIDVNKKIFETIYYGAIKESNTIARQRNEFMQTFKQAFKKKLVTFKTNNPDERDYTIDEDQYSTSDLTMSLEEFKRKAELHLPIYNEVVKLTDKLLGSYSSFKGSPAHKGKLQFDLWNDENDESREAGDDREEGESNQIDSMLTCGYDWDQVKADIKTWGLRNSLLLAPMPTASTSQILGNNECFEPLTSNIYSRRTLAGEFVVTNKYLMRELIQLGLWSNSVKNNIIQNKGSIQQISIIPENIREKYKIVWEIPMKQVIQMAADRGHFICQSQSMNLWMEDPSYKTLTAMHFFAWGKKLKTGIYYLRRKPKHQPQQFTIVPDEVPDDNKTQINPNDGGDQDDHEDEICEFCSS